MPMRQMFNEAQGLHQRGKFAEARRRYEHILTKTPHNGLVRLYLSMIQFDAGQVREAEQNARLAMKDPQKADASMWTNYGVMLKNCGDHSGAAAAYEEALHLDPDFLPAKSNLATLLFIGGNAQDAETIFLEMTEKMEEPAPWLNLARIAMDREDWTKASEYLDKAEDINPAEADVQMLRGRLAAQLFDNQESFKALQKVLQKQPAHRETWLSLQMLDASALDLHKVEEAALALVASKTESAATLAVAVNICRQNMLWKPLEALEDMLAKALQLPFESVPNISACFTLLGTTVPQNAHLSAARACWRQFTGHIKPFAKAELQPRQDCQKIRVAFLSSDLRGHAIGYTFAPMFEALPKDNIEWFIYNNSFADGSQPRDKIRKLADRSININVLTTEQLANKIYDDDIDILIDLNGMTKDTRAFVFAYRPAPIQITWIGMPGSLGGGTDVDYIIGDTWVTQEANADGFDECLIQMPISFGPVQNEIIDMDLAEARSDHMLPDEAVVFCSFNQIFKLSPDVIRVWSKILNNFDNSVLWMSLPRSEILHKQLLEQFSKHGIRQDKLIFAKAKSKEKHIARISHADLALDCWPYNGFTTTIDALRVGTPVLTFPKYKTFACSGAASIVNSFELEKWIASTEEEYIRKAIDFASMSRAEITAEKQQTLQTVQNSSILDNETLGKYLEKLFLHLYDRAAEGKEPTSLKMTADFLFSKLPFGRQER